MRERRTLRVAAVQLQSTANVEHNLREVRRWVLEACERFSAQLVLLPENFAYQGKEEGKRGVAEALDRHGPIMSTLRDLAKNHKIHLIAGGMPERTQDVGRPHNTSVHLGPSGEVVGRYRKIHLFDVDPDDGHAYRESAGTTAGQDLALTQIEGHGSEPIKVGMSICYDVRFPELYRGMRGAHIVTVPAAFTATTGKDHWHVLLRARAIENQVFVIAAAQHGTHPETGRVTYGKSLIVDPWGDVLAQAAEGAGLAVAELDFARQDAVRAAMPVLSHRRL